MLVPTLSDVALGFPDADFIFIISTPPATAATTSAATIPKISAFGFPPTDGTAAAGNAVCEIAGVTICGDSGVGALATGADTGIGTAADACVMDAEDMVGWLSGGLLRDAMLLDDDRECRGPTLLDPPAPLMVAPGMRSS